MGRTRSWVALGAILTTGAFLALWSCKKNDGKEAQDTAATGTETAAEKARKKVDPQTAGTVSGIVRFEGDVPPPTMIKASADAACTKVHPGEFSANDVKVADKKVEAAFVWVKSGLSEYEFPPASEPARIDQNGCMYNPRIIGVRVDQEIEFTNSDPTLHNINSKPKEQRGWNFVTTQGQSGRRKFAEAEVPIRIGCDVHPWMSAYVGVLDHPFFAVTKADGAFSFAGLPPGSYTVAAWHERLGTAEANITIAEKESKDVTLALTKAPGP